MEQKDEVIIKAILRDFNHQLNLIKMDIARLKDELDDEKEEQIIQFKDKIEELIDTKLF